MHHPRAKDAITRCSYSRLCLFCQTFVQWRWIEGVLHAVAQNVNDIDAGQGCRAGLIVAAGAGRAEREPARGATAGHCARIRVLWRRALYTGNWVHAGRGRGLRRHVDRVSRGLIVVTLGSHGDEVR